MERKQMKPRDITEANDPDLPASAVAMLRAAELARKTAIQTGTDVVVVKNGKLTRIPAAELALKRGREGGEVGDP
jgi:hypothetical protein